MNIPSVETIYKTLSGIVINKTKKTFSQNSLIAGFLQSMSFKVKDLYDFLDTKAKNIFYLERQTFDELKTTGSQINITPLQATKSKGYINVIVAINTVFPINTEFDIGGNVYLLDTTSTAIENVFNIEVSRNGTIATAKSSQILNFGNGLEITISGFSDANFNKTTTIQVISDYEFIYDVDDTGAIENTGGQVSFTGFISTITSQFTGRATEIENGSILTSDIESDLIVVAFNGITGGTDEEARESYLTRIKNFYVNNRNETANSKIIDFIKANFPQITSGKIVYDFDYSVDVESILIKAGEDPLTRAIKTTQPHGFKVGEVYSISGSSQNVLNIDASNTEHRYVGKIFNDFEFLIFVGDASAEDDTSLNMKATHYSYGLCNLFLYKQSSVTKTLTNEEIIAIEQFLENNVSGTSWYRLNSAQTKSETINVSNVVPNLSSLKDAIKKNLQDYFVDNIDIGTPLLKSQVEFVIMNSRDTNGTQTKSFTTDMTNDISVEQNEILDITIAI